MSATDKKETLGNSSLGAGGMEYNFRDIEKKWQQCWKESNAYKVSNESDKPKYYVLDMFPYPSGAGLHVGHPLGYIASDIYARYKRLKGFNVLHTMGYDAFGLPAEQYAIDHGIHPAVSTDANIKTFRKQLDNIGFCFDWDREVRTSDPKYYKWTQWIFLQLFNSFYNRQTNRADKIDVLINAFEKEGNASHRVPNDKFRIEVPVNGQLSSVNLFSAEQWMDADEKTKQNILMEYRLAYCGVGEVNWCEALGTVLANDEIINGVSERGGYPVVKKRLRQWYLRITEYADRLLEGLERIDFSEAMKEMQSNWIGKSSGAEIEFRLTPNPSLPISFGREGDGGEVPLSGHFFKTADPRSWQILKKYGRTNRKNNSDAEDVLWQRIRNNQLGVKVRRQHAIQGYIVDFALLEIKLVIEIDGGYHNDEEQKLYDKARTEYLSQFDLQVIRFTNDEVISNTEKVIKEIKATLEQQKMKLKTKAAYEDSSPLLRKEKGLGDEATKAAYEDSSPLLRKEKGLGDEAKLRVYTTRPDTIFGVDFMVIAPEHELIKQITSAQQKEVVQEYITYVKSRSDRERQAEKKITGVFTGGYAIHPFDARKIPIWISEYVLAGYGTGAIMAVPCGDQRDFLFAKHFNIPITNIIGSHFNGQQANPTQDAVLENSDFINGMVMKDAIEVVIKKIEELGIGVRKVNYRMHDAAFSRQRYWGEPFPIQWKNGIAYPLDEKELPLKLPHVESYKPGPDGEGPLVNIPDWIHQKVKLQPPAQTPPKQVPLTSLVNNPDSSDNSSQSGVSEWPSPPSGELEGAGALEANTMPGYAGSSWYFLRYMDPHNDKTFCDRKVSDYWNQVDLYIGGTEHAVGHLLYSRMWTKALYDLGHIGHDEPYKKLVNQGMIQGSSRFVYRIGLAFAKPSKDSKDFSFEKQSAIFLSRKRYQEAFQLGQNAIEVALFINNYLPGFYDIKKISELTIVHLSEIHVDVNIVDGIELNIEAFKKWRNSEYADAEFILEDSKYICGIEVEKMSKSKFNTVNPDDLIAKYGADTFRMYEMFLGPVEQSKPWDTKGIEGVHRFLKKLWRLFYLPAEASARAGDMGKQIWNEQKATDTELKVLHKTIKKIEDDTERFSFNTAVSGFMIAVNELTDLKCHKREILEPLLILLAPYAPHISEELYSLLQSQAPPNLSANWRKAYQAQPSLDKDVLNKEISKLAEFSKIPPPAAGGWGGGAVLDATYPVFDPKYLIESSKEYPISVNGKLRTTINMALDASQPEVEKIVLENEVVKKWLNGKQPNKIIFVKGRMVNVVI